jgi:hypothetical protein
MANIPFNLKGFSKIACDETHTTMRNKAGHEIRIAHKALSNDMREQLQALPFSDMKVRKEDAKGQEPVAERETPKKPVQSDGPNEKPQKLHDGGMVAIKKEKYDDRPRAAYADGGEVKPADEVAKVMDDAKDSGSPITINIGHPSIPESFVNPLAGQAAKDFAQSQGQPMPDTSPQLTDTFGVSKEQQAEMLAPKAPAPGTPGAQPSSQPAQPAAAAPQDQANADPYGMDAYANSLGQGIAEQKAGVLGEAQALSNQGFAQAKALNDAAKSQNTLLENAQKHFDDLDQERRNFQYDLENNHINPNHYWENKTVPGKISTVIGIILGGLGGSDAPIKFLNQQVQNDIEAQKANIGKTENLLSANLKQFGNLRDATDMTRIMQNDIVMNKIKAAAANAASPLAQAQALKAIGALDRENAGLQQQLAVRRTMMTAMSGATQDPAQMGQVIQAMRQINPEMAKSMEERYVPGVGLAQVPVPQSARDTILAKQTLQQQAQDFYNWAAKHSGSLDPATVNEGKTKAAELQSLYRNAINGGVFKKGEQEFIDTIVDSDPTKFFNSIRVLPKLKEVMNSNIQQLNTLKRGYGIPVNQIQESAPVNPGRR